MNFYRIICRCDNLNPDNAEKLSGFVATRLITGECEDDAIQKCERKIRLEVEQYEWGKDHLERVALKILNIDQISAVSYFYQYLPQFSFLNQYLGRYPKKGFTFY